mgnify:FL=1
MYNRRPLRTETAPSWQTLVTIPMFMDEFDAYMVSFLHGIVSTRLLNAQLRYKT